MGWLPNIPNPVSALGGVVKRAVPKAIKEAVGKDAYDVWNPFNNNDEAAKRKARELAAAKVRANAAAKLLQGKVKRGAYDVAPSHDPVARGYDPVDPFKGIGATTAGGWRKMVGLPSGKSGVTDAGLGVLFGSTATAAGNAQAAANALLNKPGGGGGGGSKGGGSKGGGVAGPAVPAGPTQEDILNGMYNDLIARLGQQGEASVAQFAGGKTAVQKNYDNAATDLYNKYLKSREDMVGRAENLDVTWKDDNTQAAIKRLQETSDLNEATDLSWFDKMGPLQSGLFAEMVAGTERDRMTRLNEMALAKLAAAGKGGGGGGGGGRRRSGGGGSGGAGGASTLTGSVTDTASDAYEWLDRGEYDYIQNLKKSDPITGREAELNWYADNFGDTGKETVARARQKDVYVPSFKNTLKKTSPTSDVVKTVKAGLKWASATGKNTVINKSRTQAEKDIAAKLMWALNNPSKKTTVKTTGTQKVAQPKSKVYG